MSCHILRLHVRPPSRVRLPSADQFSIIDKNKGTCCVETQNKYCPKCLALLSSRKTNFAHVTHRQLFGKKYFIKLGNWSIYNTRVPWKDHTVSINGPYV